MKKYNNEILNEIENIKKVFNEGLTIINEGTKEYDYIKNNVGIVYDSLSDAYGSYSWQKEKAFNKYEEIYRQLLYNNYSWRGFGINSKNIMQFTLYMGIEKNGICYDIYITKCYNKIIAYKKEVEEA